MRSPGGRLSQYSMSSLSAERSWRERLVTTFSIICVLFLVRQYTSGPGRVKCRIGKGLGPGARHYAASESRLFTACQKVERASSFPSK